MERTEAAITIHADRLGSILAITDSTRSKVQEYSYDSFGFLTPKTIFENSYTYAGREWDKETGLYYYRARYYDPMEGRFISKDPIGFSGGDIVLYGYVDSVGIVPEPSPTNLYLYVGNDPINWVDPLGLYRQTPTAGGPVDARTDASLKCFDACAGREVTVTAGREGGHSKGSAHEKGQACDIGKNSNPWLDRQDAQKCFKQCFDQTRSFGQEEGNHYHFQARPGKGGATGFALGIR